MSKDLETWAGSGLNDDGLMPHERVGYHGAISDKHDAKVKTQRLLRHEQGSGPIQNITLYRIEQFRPSAEWTILYAYEAVCEYKSIIVPRVVFLMPNGYKGFRNLNQQNLRALVDAGILNSEDAKGTRVLLSVRKPKGGYKYAHMEICGDDDGYDGYDDDIPF